MTGGSGFRTIKHSSRFHSSSCLLNGTEIQYPYSLGVIDSLFPFERPFEGVCTRVLDLNGTSRIIQFYRLRFATRSWRICRRQK